MKVKNKFTHACVIFTLITVITILFNLEGEEIQTIDLMYRFVITLIAVFTFYIFELLEAWPLRFVELIHYSISLMLAMGFAWLTDQYIEAIAEGGYLDLLLSYTAVYAIASTGYEIKIRLQIKHQNKYLKQIKS